MKYLILLVIFVQGCSTVRSLDSNSPLFEVTCFDSLNRSGDCYGEMDRICPLGHKIIGMDRQPSNSNNNYQTSSSQPKMRMTFICK